MKLLYTFAYINILKAEEDAPQIRVTKIAHLDITVNGEPQEQVKNKKKSLLGLRISCAQ